ncbi:helix-turn-helix domain-containing protein [Parafrankia sp. BMG5.11]|uniref:helix-turn-helix domain-containing protein n=1 Tax=Parafrankia sp. BMG5.11 TaxID=222540 RepID=UPI00103BB29C|nr:helix-turn-helix transcriptional regulator [Parafrankia sp. BMG5.11]TCJ39502.1 XRE family transcriptional regulator [Parafrankia sp. BMG5.11]
MMTEQDYLGSKLYLLRRESKLTLAELGKRVGVSKPTIWAWENCKAYPRKERIPAIAQALGISENELILPRVRAEPFALSEALSDEIARSRARIAALAGITSQKVLIAITF